MLFSSDSDTDPPESAISPAYHAPVAVLDGTVPAQAIVSDPPPEMLADEHEPSSRSPAVITGLEDRRSSLVKAPVAAPPPFDSVTEHDRVEPTMADDGQDTLDTETSAGVDGCVTVTMP